MLELVVDTRACWVHCCMGHEAAVNSRYNQDKTLAESYLRCCRVSMSVPRLGLQASRKGLWPMPLQKPSGQASSSTAFWPLRVEDFDVGYIESGRLKARGTVAVLVAMVNGGYNTKESQHSSQISRAMSHGAETAKACREVLAMIAQAICNIA